MEYQGYLGPHLIYISNNTVKFKGKKVEIERERNKRGERGDDHRHHRRC